MKIVISFILMLFWSSSSFVSFNQCLKCDERAIYIKAESTDIINLDETYLEIKETTQKIKFSFGIDPPGINEFVFIKETNEKRELTDEELMSLQFSSIKDLENTLIKNNKLENPNKCFTNIFVVHIESKNKSNSILYEVLWERYYSIE